MKKSILLIFSFTMLTSNIYSKDYYIGDNIKDITKEMGEIKTRDDGMFKDNVFFKKDNSVFMLVHGYKSEKVISVWEEKRFNNDLDNKKCEKDLVLEREKLEKKYKIKLEKGIYRKNNLDINILCRTPLKDDLIPFKLKKLNNSSALWIQETDRIELGKRLRNENEDNFKRKEAIKRARVHTFSEDNLNLLAPQLLHGAFELEFGRHSKNKKLEIEEKNKIDFFDNYKLDIGKYNTLNAIEVSKMDLNKSMCQKNMKTLDNDLSMSYKEDFLKVKSNWSFVSIFGISTLPAITEYENMIQLTDRKIFINIYCKKNDKNKYDLTLLYRDKYIAEIKAIELRIKVLKEELKKDSAKLRKQQKEKKNVDILKSYVILKQSYISELNRYKYIHPNFVQNRKNMKNSIKANERHNKMTDEIYELKNKYQNIMNNLRIRLNLEKQLNGVNKNISELIREEENSRYKKIRPPM